MVLADRKLKLREIADTLKISKGSVFTILHQHLSMRSITTLQSQIDSQLSGQRRVKTVQSGQKRKCQLVRFWLSYFGMHKVFYSSITLRKEEPSIANIIWRYWCV